MDKTATLTIRSDIGEIPGFSIRLEELMLASGFSPDAILDTQLAVEEAITNIIVHGYRNESGEIRIFWKFEKGRAEIQIIDTAPAFDPLSIPEPDIEGDMDERRIGGLGVYLIRQLMDEFSYRYEDGKNIFTLIKKRMS